MVLGVGPPDGPLGRAERAAGLDAAHTPDKATLEMEIRLREAGMKSKPPLMMPAAWVALGLAVVIAVIALLSR
jgi:hypothetical protein